MADFIDKPRSLREPTRQNGFIYEVNLLEHYKECKDWARFLLLVKSVIFVRLYERGKFT